MSRGKQAVNFYRFQVKKTIRESGSIACALCVKPITKIDDVNVDHILPKSRGGDSRFSNLQPTHKRCNSQKGSRVL